MVAHLTETAPPAVRRLLFGEGLDLRLQLVGSVVVRVQVQFKIPDAANQRFRTFIVHGFRNSLAVPNWKSFLSVYWM